MFDDFFNDKSRFPTNFEVPFDDFMERIIMKDVGDIDGLIDSFGEVLKDLERFRQQNYEITIADDNVIFQK